MTTFTETRHDGEFLVSEANGTQSRAAITIADAEGALVAGTVLGEVTATGEYRAYDPVAADGSEVAAGILINGVDATDSAVSGVAIVRDAEVNGQEITGSDAAAVTALEALGIIVR